MLQLAKCVDASLPSYAQHAPQGPRRGGGLLALTLTDGKRGAGTGAGGRGAGGRGLGLAQQRYAPGGPAVPVDADRRRHTRPLSRPSVPHPSPALLRRGRWRRGRLRW